MAHYSYGVHQDSATRVALGNDNSRLVRHSRHGEPTAVFAARDCVSGRHPADHGSGLAGTMDGGLRIFFYHRCRRVPYRSAFTPLPEKHVGYVPGRPGMRLVQRRINAGRGLPDFRLAVHHCISRGFAVVSWEWSTLLLYVSVAAAILALIPAVHAANSVAHAGPSLVERLGRLGIALMPVGANMLGGLLSGAHADYLRVPDLCFFSIALAVPGISESRSQAPATGFPWRLVQIVGIVFASCLLGFWYFLRVLPMRPDANEGAIEAAVRGAALVVSCALWAVTWCGERDLIRGRTEGSPLARASRAQLKCETYAI